MRVIGDRSAALRQAARLGAAARTLAVMATACAAVAVGGWLWLIWRSLQPAADWPTGWVGAVGLISLAAVLLPRWADDVRAQATTVQGRVAAVTRLETTLTPLLDFDWTLVINAADSDGNAVLVGPHGVFALTLVTSDITRRNAGPDWQQRTPEGQWATGPDNPTRHVQAVAERLSALWAIDVLPRVVWAGHGLLLAEEPAVPIWHLGQLDPLLADLFGRPPLDEEALLVTLRQMGLQSIYPEEAT